MHDPVGWVDPLGLAGCGRSKLTKRDKVLAENNIRDKGKKGTTVLGSWRAKPGKLNYIDKAKKTDASYFDVGKEWNSMTKRGVEWDANTHFLDTIANKGDDVILSIPKSDIKPGSYLADEVSYLTGNKGYTWVNQWKLVIK